MRPDTILVPTGCDLKRLPLDASEVFLLSRLDGQLTLEDIAEVCGLEFERAQDLAERLVSLGVAKPRRIDPRAEPEPKKPEPKKPEPKQRRSTRSMKAQRAAEDVCELDEATQTKIKELDAKCGSATFYELLGVQRDADPKEIERAYLSLARDLDPAHFARKKLGTLRGALDRVFGRITQASVTLGSRPRRDAYDATLAPPPPAPPRKPSKRVRRSQPEKPAARAPVAEAPSELERFKRLQASAKMLAGQTRAATLMKAGDDALQSGDVIGAANNYRLALQMHDDPIIKDKLAAIDRHSRDLRHEKYVIKARGAERAERWDEAADHYLRANEVRKAGAVAERAANALRLANGDLRQATALAEQAVAENDRNADYRVTLAEVLLAAKLVVRAKEECEQALALAPNHVRALSLAAALKKQ